MIWSIPDVGIPDPWHHVAIQDATPCFEGVKSVRSRGPGDLLCRAVVETPVNLTSRQRELLEEFEATFEGDEGRRHSPRSSTFLDGVKAFWERMTG